MDMYAASRVVAIEKLSGGVVVTFDDGVSALFSAPLLRCALEHAAEMMNRNDPRSPAGPHHLKAGTAITFKKAATEWLRKGFLLD